MTADGSQGVIVWSEDINNRYIVRRQDFTVDETGELDLGEPVTILPLIDEEAPPGDHLFYFSVDVWGDANHDSLYMTVLRIYSINSGDDAGGGTRDALIYDLNDLTDVTASPDERVFFHEWVAAGGVLETVTWPDAGDPMELPDCATVPYPQLVPTCYRAESLRFNASGTRIYLERNIDDSDGERWDTVMRVNVDMGGGPTLADWTLSGPELVYTGTSFEYWPHGVSPRPGSARADSEGNPLPQNLPSPEIIGMTWHERTPNRLNFFGEYLNADQCASDYAFLSDGSSSYPPDHWKNCFDSSLLLGDGGGEAWQSQDAYLVRKKVKRQEQIFRHYVDGEFAGTEQLLIENGGTADTGL